MADDEPLAELSPDELADESAEPFDDASDDAFDDAPLLEPFAAARLSVR
ncbi:MAG TPA: hypothetical protein VFR23_14530 [Jiangellaceae bacterium]|nr:hypothetical protein [Jiangellaceae bacterium]